MVSVTKKTEKTYNKAIFKLHALSTDTLPTGSIDGVKILNGSKVKMIDNAKEYLYDEAADKWEEQPSWKWEEQE